jgi:hypothetical protein
MDTPRDDWLVSEQFRVARVSNLPYAHNPSRCTQASHFEEAKWDGVAGRRFFESLTDEQFRACYYHQLADWKLVAWTSVQLYRTCRNKLKSELDAALSQTQLSQADQRELAFLFHDPIVWGGAAPSVTNGQHRICAIRAAGAGLCVIDHNRLDPYAPAPSPH